MKLVDLNKVHQPFCMGVYRIFINIKGKEYNYIGMSEDIYSRLTTHYDNLWSAFERISIKGKGITKMFYDSKQNYSLYLKIFSWCIYNNKKFEDIEYEILPSWSVGDQKNTSIEEVEINEIINYNSILQGFNSWRKGILDFKMLTGRDIVKNRTKFNIELFKNDNKEIIKHYEYCINIRNELEKKFLNNNKISFYDILPWNRNNKSVFFDILRKGKYAKYFHWLINKIENIETKTKERKRKRKYLIDKLYEYYWRDYLN